MSARAATSLARAAARALPAAMVGALAGAPLLAHPWTAVFAQQAQRPAAPACAPEAPEPARVAGLDQRFDILLGDGRTAALVGVAFEPDAAGRGAFAAWLAASDLRMRAADQKTDRWGRRPVHLFARTPDGDGRVNVAEVALEQGLGRYRPDAAAHACRDRLLAAEARARAAKAGLWADPGRAIVAAIDRPAVAAAPAGMAIVEGVVSGFGDSGGRVYLNFGKVRTVDLAIVISKRNIATFDMQGLTPRDLVGKRIRARGLIDRRFGPLMEIGAPDALELIDDGPAPAGGTKG